MAPEGRLGALKTSQPSPMVQGMVLATSAEGAGGGAPVDPHAGIRAAIAERLETATPLERRAHELFAKGGVKLPAIPTVARKLLPLLSRPNADLAECVKLIEVDRVLGAAMLRCANSAAFFRGRHVTNVRDAIMRIGLRGAAGLALSLSTTALYDQRVTKALAFVGSDFETEWRRSALVAHAAREIATQLKIGNAELAFTGGLFQNVGQALAAYLLATLALTDREAADMPMDARRAATARMRGPLMGEYVLKEDLPMSMSQVLLELEEPLDRTVSPTTLVVRLTLSLTTTAEMDDTTKKAYLERGLEAAKGLALDRERLAAVKELIAESRGNVEHFAAK